MPTRKRRNDEPAIVAVVLLDDTGVLGVIRTRPRRPTPASAQGVSSGQPRGRASRAK
jgi:hypothetical protein